MSRKDNLIVNVFITAISIVSYIMLVIQADHNDNFIISLLTYTFIFWVLAVQDIDSANYDEAFTINLICVVSGTILFIIELLTLALYESNTINEIPCVLKWLLFLLAATFMGKQVFDVGCLIKKKQNFASQHSLMHKKKEEKE